MSHAQHTYTRTRTHEHGGFARIASLYLHANVKMAAAPSGSCAERKAEERKGNGGEKIIWSSRAIKTEQAKRNGENGNGNQ